MTGPKGWADEAGTAPERASSAVAHWVGACWRAAYNFGGTLALPLIGGWWLHRRLERRPPDQVPERLGWLRPELAALSASDDPLIWVQCASAGEVNAAAPIVRELQVRAPLAHIVLSTNTWTGERAAQHLALPIDGLFRAPLDAPAIIEHLLGELRPTVLVLVEAEIWPNLVTLARRWGTKIVIVNGRISDRAFPRDRLARPLFEYVLRHVTAIGAQSALDAERFVAIGANPQKVFVGGNSKFDVRRVVSPPAEAARWRQEFGFRDEDLVLVAGSTHEGEEEIVLSVFDQLRFEFHNLQLVLAPRHPERGKRVHQLVREHGYDVYRRSHVLQAREAGQEIGVPAASATRVVILDTIGELASVYSAADLVIMGGSLRRGLGGHNLLEPIAQGKYVLFGRYMASFRDISAIVIREGCGQQVESLAELQAQCVRLLSDAALRQEAAERGRRMLEKYAGASVRYAQLIADLVEGAKRALPAFEAPPREEEFAFESPQATEP